MVSVVFKMKPSRAYIWWSNWPSFWSTPSMGHSVHMWGWCKVIFLAFLTASPSYISFNSLSCGPFNHILWRSFAFLWFSKLTLTPCVGVGNRNPLQYSRLENSMNSGARQATVHGITKWATEHTHTRPYMYKWQAAALFASGMAQ